MNIIAQKLLESKFVKITPWVLGITFMAGGIYGASTYQTKKEAIDYQKNAEITFVKREVQDERDKRADERWQEIIKRLDRIDKKQDEFINARRK